jgi:hypothetical protein
MAGFGGQLRQCARGPSDSRQRARIRDTIDAIDIALVHFCARTVSPASREIAPLAKSDRWDYESGMKFQFSIRDLRVLTMLAAVTVTLPAAAQERGSEPPLKSRDAKTAGAAAPTVDLKIEGVGNGLQIRVLPKEEGPARDGGKGTSCKEDCELKLPAGSYTLIATQVEPQEMPGKDSDAPPPLTVSESEAGRHRLGSALGVGGIVAAAMGSYLAIGALVASDGAPAASPSGPSGFFFVGVAGIAVGAGLMVGGFSLAAANRGTPVGIDRMPPVVQRRDPVGVSLSGTF